MNLLANLITVLSLASGFISIILSLNAHFTFAAWGIIISVILDGLDGQVARRNPSPSDFGKELDSLVDVVSFGIAPSILGYTFLYRHLSFWAILALFFYLFCGVMRLAKYNITPKEKLTDFFWGLPTTASGGVLASFVLMFRNKQITTLPHSISWVFLFLALVLSILMVSRVKYFNLQGFKQMSGEKFSPAVFSMVALFILNAFLKRAGIALFLLFLIYLIFSPFVVKRLSNAR